MTRRRALVNSLLAPVVAVGLWALSAQPVFATNSSDPGGCHNAYSADSFHAYSLAFTTCQDIRGASVLVRPQSNAFQCGLGTTPGSTNDHENYTLWMVSNVLNPNYGVYEWNEVGWYCGWIWNGCLVGHCQYIQTMGWYEEDLNGGGLWEHIPIQTGRHGADPNLLHTEYDGTCCDGVTHWKTMIHGTVIQRSAGQGDHVVQVMAGVEEQYQLSPQSSPNYTPQIAFSQLSRRDMWDCSGNGDCAANQNWNCWIGTYTNHASPWFESFWPGAFPTAFTAQIYTSGPSWAPPANGVVDGQNCAYKWQ